MGDDSLVMDGIDYDNGICICGDCLIYEVSIVFVRGGVDFWM